MRSRSNVLLFLASLAGWHCAGADLLLNGNANWLEAMSFAAHHTDYNGIFIYQDGMGGHVEVSRITHVSDSDGEHERLEGLNGKRREIVSNNNQVWLFLGDRKVQIEKHHRERTFPALLPEQIATLKDNYLITQTEGEMVAGFHAHVVTFQPKDNLRYVHKMWVHSEAGLLLKAVVLDEHSRVIEQYAFTQLTLGGQIDRTWIEQSKATLLPPANAPATPPAKPTEMARVGDWQVDALPSGFKKITEFSRPMRDRKTLVTHLVFSDGLSGISIFIEDVGDREEVNSGLSNQGSIQVYRRVCGDKLITVVGEVPPRTVMQVAESVRYAGQ